jgi:hypothetical protein
MGEMKMNRLISVLAQSHDIRDEFLCVKGEFQGVTLYWDYTHPQNALRNKENGRPVHVGFSHGGNSMSEWIIIRNY